MAKGVKAAARRPDPLVIGLGDPGMTPLLRGGLGGLAAALRFLRRESDRKAAWPGEVKLAGGIARVEPARVIIEWGDADPEEVLQDLFERCFRLTKPLGLIDLAGTYEPERPPADALAAAWQGGLKRTFLQHGKTTPKAGAPKPVTTEIDGRPVQFEAQGYLSFAHQGVGADVAKALTRGRVSLAGWAYPGAAQRHIQFNDTKFSYTASEATAAAFALIGCVSFAGTRGGAGALVVPEPADLVAFAEIRPRLSPRTAAESYVSGLGDAVLAVSAALRMDDVLSRRGVAAAHGVLFATTVWAKQQKSRVATISGTSYPPAVLDQYEKLVSELPNAMRARGTGEADAEEGGIFAVASALRAFVSDNLARGRPWHFGFADARTAEKKPRWIHRDGRDQGALYATDKKGLVAMVEHLDGPEEALVASVHVALRQRFGAIASESKDAPGAMKNRFQRERDKWRLAFAGAKTQEQVRAALADLWSRAGSNSALQEGWRIVLPLLNGDNWRTARDLALVALASYQGRDTEAEAEGAE
ncbi:MAG: type I-MYXAN CRISPR-associated Cas8a1/Cmx1 [Deltaproteobacteria bacterium]|nr:type I-MYXAN CRISPR-associated Cas8a1/Cmx1 [Deltaproteobacteria bacterium]